MASRFQSFINTLSQGSHWADQVTDLDELDRQLAGQEKRYLDIVPGTEKKIIWANPDNKSQTDYAGVYFHGFSASRQEPVPVPDEVMAGLNGNLFYTRLAGHGRSGATLGKVSMKDWLRDAEEALAITRRLGRKQILFACSTGACLALRQAAQSSENIAAVVLISPNLKLRDPNAWLLATPLGPMVARLKIGKNRSRPTGGELREKYWTAVYPSKALVPMMRLVRYTNKLDFTQLQVPVMMIYSPDDTITDTQHTEAVYAQLPSEHKHALILHSDHDPADHIVVGDILAPSNTQTAVDEINRWLNKVL